MHNKWNLEADGPQQQETTLGSTATGQQKIGKALLDLFNLDLIPIKSLKATSIRTMHHFTKLKSSQADFPNMTMISLCSNGLHSHQI